jgi:hypothetical protein
MSRIHFSNRRIRLIFLVLIAIFFTTLQVIVNAEVNDEEAVLEIREGFDDLTLKLVQGIEEVDFTFHVEETGGERPAFFKIFPTDLRDEDTGRKIDVDQIDIYIRGTLRATNVRILMAPNEIRDIKVVINTRDVKASTYKGQIEIFGYNNTRDFTLPLTVQVRQSLWIPGLCVFFGVATSFILNSAGISIQSLRDKKFNIEQTKNNILNKINWFTAIIIILSLIISFIFTFSSYYPRIGDFGASVNDYFSAFIFGLGTQGVLDTLSGGNNT